MFGKGNSTSEIAETLGVDEAQIQEWLKDWESGEETAGTLVPKEPKPPTKPGAEGQVIKRIDIAKEMFQKHPKFKIGISKHSQKALEFIVDNFEYMRVPAKRVTDRDVREEDAFFLIVMITY